MKKIILCMAVLLTALHMQSQCACCAGAGVGSSNGDYNNGILTLPKKMWVAETYADYRTIKNGDAVEEDEKLLKNMLINSIGVRYGITDKITVAALLPYVSLQTNEGNDSGLGDLILMGTFRIFSKNNFNFALQAGIELPTGIQKESNFDNTTVVIGSGSYDPMAGVSFSKNWSKIVLQGSALYKQTTNGFDGNYYGSLAVQNLSVSYKIKGESSFCSLDTLLNTKAKSNFALSAFTGYYGEWLDKLKEEDEVDENSGHYLGFALLGVNASYKTWAFPVTVSLPVITNMNGDQNDSGCRFRLGIIKSF